jgi:uncharacterized membrane protein
VPSNAIAIGAHKSGLYQGFDRSNLLALCNKEDIVIYFLYPIGSFVMQGNPILAINNKKELPEDFEILLSRVISIDNGQAIDISYTYGFRQLMEIAVKALSPGINDPETAIISLQAIGDLLAYKLQHFPQLDIPNGKGTVRIITKEMNFDEAFNNYIMPIWDYGKNDRLIQQEMFHILSQLQMKREKKIVSDLLGKVQMAINAKHRDIAIT